MLSMILFYCFIGLRLPRQPKAARLTSATAWKNFPSFRDPIWDQVLLDGLYWSTCKQARHHITSQRIPHNTSSLFLSPSSSPPVTTTYWCRWPALRPRSCLEKLFSAVNNQRAKGAKSIWQIASFIYKVIIIIARWSFDIQVWEFTTAPNPILI